MVFVMGSLSFIVKHPKVRTWLDRNKRFVFHFTPTSSSWLNAVQVFFANSQNGASTEMSSNPSSISWGLSN